MFNLTSLTAWGAGAFATDTLVNFATPAQEFRPKIRWWWVHGIVDPDEVRREVDQIHSAGFGGFELQDVHHSIAEGTVLGDLTTEGWGGQAWQEGLQAALEQSETHGLTHDLGMGPCWPLGVPTYGADDPPAAKEIAVGRTFVSGGANYSDVVPPPRTKAASGVNNSTLVAVQAWRVDSSSSSSADPVIIEEGSMIDLIPYISGDTIVWTPPGNATWLILSARIRGTGQVPEDSPHTSPATYVADHFSKTGVQAATDYWDESILSDSILTLLSNKESAFMEDSLEMVTNGYWTTDFPAEFRSRRGYNVADVLPVLMQYKNKFFIEFSDSDLTRGARNDYWDTLSDLYLEYHVKPLQAWAESKGTTYRVQPYGGEFKVSHPYAAQPFLRLTFPPPAFPLDSMRAAAASGIAEGESLGFKANDDYRALAGALGMAQKKVLSNELGAYSRAAYTVSWNDILRTVNPQFAAGVSQNVVHGFSYANAPGAVWPGFAAFTPYGGTLGYSESWGPRQPTWRHASDFTDYLARVQYMMQRGIPKHDVAIFRRNGAVDSHYVGPYFTSEGAKLGWSANYVNPGVLGMSTAVVSSKRLAPDAANYSLLVIPGDPAVNGAPTLTAATATLLKNYAEAGLPIIFVGNWTDPRAYGYAGLKFGSTAGVKSAVQSMLTRSNVVNVASASDIPAGIAQLGVSRKVEFSSSNMVYLRREDGDVDNYVFTANSSSTGVSQTVILPRRSADGVPVLIDPWTGNVSGIPLYSVQDDGRLSIPLSLNPSQAILLSVLPLTRSKPTYATVTTAQSLVYDANSTVAVRATEAGEYTTTLNDGTTSKTTIDVVLPVQTLSNWTLNVDDWQPANGDGTTGNVTETKILKHSLSLNSLESWPSITELADVSGIGTYNTSFTLGTLETPLSTGMGAYLKATAFGGSFRIKVNGESIGPSDQLAVQFDIGSYVKNGTNTLEIEIATTLLNRMRVLYPDVYGGKSRSNYGLMGVTIQPYTQAAVV